MRKLNDEYLCKKFLINFSILSFDNYCKNGNYHIFSYKQKKNIQLWGKILSASSFTIQWSNESFCIKLIKFVLKSANMMRAANLFLSEKILSIIVLLLVRHELHAVCRYIRKRHSFSKIIASSHLAVLNYYICKNKYDIIYIFFNE